MRREITIRYFIVLISLIIVMRVIDSYLTKVAISDGIGSEMNHLVLTESVFSVFFSPIPFLVSLVMIGLIAYHFKIREHIPEILRGGYKKYYLVAFPYYYIMGMILVLLNNILVLIGAESFIGKFIDIVGAVVGAESRFRGLIYCLFFSFAFTIFDPFTRRYLEKKYGV